MDPSFLLMLSNLLHLHNYLDPSSSLLSSSSSSSPSSPPCSCSSSSSSSSPLSSSAAPLLFFALASVLSYASSSLSSISSSSSSPPPPRPPPSSSPSSFFSSFSSSNLWSLPPSSRDARCRALFGLSYPVFATILDHLRPFPLPLSLPLDHALSLALARLSRGLSSRRLSRLLHLPPSLISRSTHALTRLLATRLYPDYIKPPVSHRLLRTTHSFRDISALPNLCGAIASSPVRLHCGRGLPLPPLLSSKNRPFPSILLQIVADGRKIFWDACVRAPGSADAATHFRDSRLYRRLSSSDFLRDSVVTVNGHHVRPYLAGDESFPLLPFLLTPFSSSHSNSNPAHEAFDAALTRARAASVEPAVALLKGRWKILRKLNVGLDHAAQTVVACVVLHNICQIAGEPEDDGKYFWRDPPESPQMARPVESERSLYYAGESVRQALAEDLYERQQKISGGR